MLKCPIIFGPLNKKLFLPLILCITQIIYIIINEYSLGESNEIILHLFLLSFGEMSIKLLPLLLKINNKSEEKEKIIKKKKCLHYFLICFLYIMDASLIGGVSFAEIHLLDIKAYYTGSNLFPNNDFIIMSIELVFLLCISICLLKYKYFRHHIISLIIFTIFGIISDILINNYENLNGYFFLIQFMRILEVGVNATYYCFQKYMMEKLYYPYWNIAFVPGVVLFYVSGGLLVYALTDRNKENSSMDFIRTFYLYYKQPGVGVVVGRILVDFISHIIMCPLAILIVYYFTPNFILIVFMLTRITQKLIYASKDKLYCLIFYIFQFIAMSIHLEILELNFCGLNKFTKRNVDLRGIEDVLGEGRDSSLGLGIDYNKDLYLEAPQNDVNSIEMSDKFQDNYISNNMIIN